MLDVWSHNFDTLLSGLWVSVRVTAVTLLIGLPAALALALCVRSPRRRLRGPAIAGIELGRGVPALVLLQIAYFGLPAVGIVLSAFQATVAALAGSTAVYVSETFRGGLQSVPRGTLEGAQALGMSRVDEFRFVMLPQMVRIVIPPIMSQAILVFQTSSLAYTIALPELMNKAYQAASSDFQYLSIFALVGVMYAAITIPAGWATGRLERRLSRHLL